MGITEPEEVGRIDTGYLFELDNYTSTMSNYVTKHGTTEIQDTHGHTEEIELDFFCSGYEENVNWYSIKSNFDDNW